jgi:hypothetical protein
MFQFEKISLKQIMILSEILVKSALQEFEFIKEKYLKMSENFEETVEFMNKIDLIAKSRNKISPKPIYHSILKKKKEYYKKEEEMKEFLVNIFIVKKNPFTDYLIEYLSLFKLIDHRFEFKSRTIQRLKFSGLRNFLIDLGFIYLDSNQKKHVISDDYFETFSELRKSYQLSLNEFLRIFQKREKLSKTAEIEILNYEKKRLSKFPNLAKKVKLMSEKNILAGYDIKSFTENDKNNRNPCPRYIEVKAVSSKDFRFFWTRNEINSSKLYKQNYYLYLVPVLSMVRFDLDNIVIIRNPYLNVYKNKDKWLRKVELIEFTYQKNK